MLRLTTVSVLILLAVALSGCSQDRSVAPENPAPTPPPSQKATIRQPPPEEPQVPAHPTPEPCKGCNVLLITFDALRADHVGIYGYRRNATPNLDTFGKEAYLFTDVLAQAGTTLMSFPSLFTGKFPVTDRLYTGGGQMKLKEKERTLAQLLKQAGYHTAGISSQRFTSSQFGFSRGFDLYDEAFKMDEPAARTLDRGLEMLDKLKKPFFLWIHFMPPHYPYEITPEIFAEFMPEAAKGPNIATKPIKELVEHFGKSEPLTSYHAPFKRDLTPSVVQQIIAQYDGHLRSSDRAFGTLMATLKKRGLEGNTVVVFGADHGEDLGEHRYFGHNRLTRASLHVPLMIRVPKKQHVKIHYPAMNVDIFPTVLNLVQAPATHPIRGRDLLTGFEGHPFQLAEYEDKRAIKKGAFLYVELHEKTRLDPGQPARKSLYHVENDPTETENLLDTKPAMVAELTAIRQQLKTLHAGKAKPSDQVPLEPKSHTIEKLKKLGYINDGP